MITNSCVQFILVIIIFVIIIYLVFFFKQDNDPIEQFKNKKNASSETNVSNETNENILDEYYRPVSHDIKDLVSNQIKCHPDCCQNPSMDSYGGLNSEQLKLLADNKSVTEI